MTDSATQPEDPRLPYERAIIALDETIAAITSLEWALRSREDRSWACGLKGGLHEAAGRVEAARDCIGLGTVAPMVFTGEGSGYTKCRAPDIRNKKRMN